MKVRSGHSYCDGTAQADEWVDPERFDPAAREALDAVRRGFRVFPVRARDKRPAGMHGFKDATDDEQEIRAIARACAGINWGVATGRVSGLIVIDVDPRNGGDAHLDELERAYGKLPLTATVATGGGGHHYHFVHPCGEPIRCRQLAPGIDLKADGGYVVLPGSIHPSGDSYRWVRSPRDTALAPAPEWILLSHPFRQKKTDVHRRDREIASVGLSELEDIIVATLPGAEGERNRRLFELARRLKGLPELASAPLPSLRPIVKRWHARALPFIGTKDFDTTWAEFTYAWPRVKYPRGRESFIDIALRAPAVPSAAEQRYENEQVRHLIRICQQMQTVTGDAPFFISCRTAAGKLGISADTAALLLHMLIADGVLIVVAAHTAKRARRFRFYGG